MDPGTATQPGPGNLPTPLTHVPLLGSALPFALACRTPAEKPPPCAPAEEGQSRLAHWPQEKQETHGRQSPRPRQPRAQPPLTPQGAQPSLDQQNRQMQDKDAIVDYHGLCVLNSVDDTGHPIPASSPLLSALLFRTAPLAVSQKYWLPFVSRSVLLASSGFPIPIE